MNPSVEATNPEGLEAALGLTGGCRTHQASQREWEAGEVGEVRGVGSLVSRVDAA